MERMTAKDFDQDLLDLYDFYVHGHITKREFLDRSAKWAVGGLTAVAIFDMLKPNYALAEQVSFNDPDILAEYITYPSPNGTGPVRGYLVKPAQAEGRLPAVLVVHENRGLNPYIEDVARRAAKAGFLALAPDGLTSVGGYPGNDAEGRELQRTVDREKLMNDFFAAFEHLHGRDDSTGKVGAVGFIGNATDATAHYFGVDAGRGTMPHAFIGYAGSTLRAAEMYDETFPDEPMTVLVDYFAREVTDTLTCCRRFPQRAAEGSLAVRIDTPGGRFIEGLDPPESYAVLERNAPGALRGYRSDDELRYLVGPGVSAAAIWRMRECLNREGFHKVKIVASSGFGPAKCRLMAEAKAPVDVIGTGSYLPSKWSETYATADVVEYDGVPRVKVGREFLLRR